MATEQRPDPIPPLKRQPGACTADIVHAWNGDDMGVILGVDRFRVADLRRQKRGRERRGDEPMALSGSRDRLMRGR